MSGIETATAIGIAKKAAEAAALDIYKNTKGLATKSLDSLMVEFGVGVKKYLSRNFDRCRYVKTLLHRIDPIPIDAAYVDPTFTLRKVKVPGKDFLGGLAELKRIIVTGRAGSGKSMFLKHTFLSLCNQPFGRIPLFFELRELNESADRNLIASLLAQLSSLIPSFSLDRFEYGLRTGKFAILLDGLDEVSYSAREDCCKQLLDLVYKYPECLFLLTSRPDERFESWHEFYESEILPMNEGQVVDLINKMEFDATTKSNFLIQVKKSLFKSHRTFLSNPLLCTMMLLTYTEFEEVPSKMHIFYSRAFDALFSRHDKTKTAFKRKFYTTLSEDDFKKYFATLCLLTFVDRKITFDHNEAIKYINAVFKFEKVNLSAEAFLKDLVESVSILLKDGIIYSFLHRSFQEYFVATFLATRQFAKIDRVFDRCFFFGDDVAALLVEINKDSFETKYLLKKLRFLRTAIDKANLMKNPQKILALFFDYITLVQASNEVGPRNWMVTGGRHGKWLNILNLLNKYYIPSSKADLLFSYIVSPDFGLELGEALKTGRIKRATGKEISGDISVATIPGEIILKVFPDEFLSNICTAVQRLDDLMVRRAQEKQDFVSELVKWS